MPTAKRQPPDLISRSELARRLGVTRSAVTIACREGGRLHGAIAGKLVDVRHEAIQRWLVQRGKASEIPAPEKTSTEIVAELGQWREQIDLATLEEPLKTLTERYGQYREFAGWVQQRKNLADARRHEMLQARVAGRLIARTTVQNMLGHVDVAFRLLLTDAPRKIATQVAPQDMTRTASVIRDTMEQMLEAAKAHMMASIQNDDAMAPLVEAAE